MEYKKSLIILTILTIFLFGISSAFASDMNDAAITIEHDMPIESTQDDDIKADEVFTDNPKTFTQLDNEINESQDTFEVKYNYAFNNESDYGPVVIDKSNFTINGNNHILDGNGQSGIFNITGNNITINNLIFINGNSFRGSAIYSAGQTTLNNVTFINNNAYGGAIYSNGQLTLNNATFINNTAQGGAIYTNGQTTLNNVTFINNTATSGGAIYTNGQTTLNNATLINNTAHWGGAIYSSGQTTLNNVTFINNTATSGGAIYSNGQTTLNNVTFINNTATSGGAITHYNYIINCNNSRFIDNYAEWGSSLYSDDATINICNTFFTSCISNKHGQIYIFSSTVNIDNVDFINISSTYSPAIYFEDCENSITNSRFINLTANISAGAIAIKRSGNTYIKGCEFINTKSFKNAGAIIVDYTIEEYETNIFDCVFENTSSMIGGAYIQLSGSLIMNNTNFTNNNATYYGGAVYISSALSLINNCIFDSNDVELLDDYPTYGGAIYSDLSYIVIINCKFTNNSAYIGNAIYARDSLYNITDSTFANNTNAIYTDFDLYFDLCNLENNDYNGDTVITNQSFYYQTFVDTPTLNLTLTNNTITVIDLPCRFDLQDWGWVTPIKNQERKGACWTFVLISAVESALLKEYGIELDLSENNMFNYALRYSPYGYLTIVDGGYIALSVSNLVSWCGPVLEELDVYDEVGKLSPPLQVDYNIVHIQDVIRIPNDEIPESSKIKTTILNYGALAAIYYLENDNINGYYNPETYAQYINESITPQHTVSIIGWDDNFSKDNFIITPPGDGAWIAKNSWGTEWGDNGILYISYYDKTLAPKGFKNTDAFGIVIENTIPYNKNYQHDFTWAENFIDMNYMNGVDGNITYANQFEAAGDDLIAAVGTYFNESGVNYTVEIYVNDQLKLTQEGISPFKGYHTIKLNEYIPIKTGDIFKAAITSNTMPCINCLLSRVHYTENISFFYYEGEWVDLFTVLNHIACLKVYTVEDKDNIINYTFKDLSRHINQSGDIFEMAHDYKFNNESDYGPVVIAKSNFTINGNNHILDGNGQSGIFNITGNNITINNLVFINGNSIRGGAIYSLGQITLNNATFINNNAQWGGAIYSFEQVTLNNATIINNTSNNLGAIFSFEQLTLNNATFINNNAQWGGAIYSLEQLTLNNTTFINNNATYGGAIFSEGQLTLNNATFINNTAHNGGAIYSFEQLTLNNTTFINNNATYGGAIVHYDYIINCNNSRFIDNHAELGSSLYSDNATINICNTFFTLGISSKYGQIHILSSTVNIDNVDFINMSTTYSPAIYFEDCENSITNSRFINLTANISAGAIAIKKSGPSYIKGCEFINTKSFKNAGAIIVDYANEDSEVTVLDCVFENTSSMIGGAYIQLGGSLIMNNTNFTNNNATYYGGAVYISFADSQITNCIFDSNGVELLDDYPTYGGAIYSDYSYLEISKSKFTNNSAYMGNAIYVCDSTYEITDSTFANNTNAIYTDFDFGSCNLENNDYNGDSIITNQSYYYQTYVDTPTLNLTLTNNTITVTGLPCRFDLRDWGWVTPIKNQGKKGACGTFGMISALESTLLKAYGIELDLSENNIANNNLRYSPYGRSISTEGEWLTMVASYLVSWYSPVLEELDIYDEIGKLSPPLQTDYDIIHIQDVIIIPNDEVPESSKIKTTILNYGALAVHYYLENDNINGYYNPETSAQYIDENIYPTHTVSIIGWDDNFSKDNFIITPPGDGAWIAKNSWGTEWGNEGILYISYYDKTLAPGEIMDYDAFGIVIENTIPYNKNYQHDFILRDEFIDMKSLSGVDSNITYANQFESAGDDLIAAVGTYFNESDINYTVEIYVNDQLKLTQEGISPFGGYHTIKLNEYIPIKTGDIFKAAITSNTMPCINCQLSRVHYTENISFFYYEGEWVDLYTVEDYVACLKVYTVNDDTKIINNDDISVDYADGNYFSVEVVTADGHKVGSGEVVKFTINGKTTTVTTDNSGIAKIKITDVPKKYTMTTTYNGKSYKNTVTVKQVLTASKVTVKKTAKKLTLKATLKINGKLQKGKVITFKFNGKTYKVKTNAKGIAQKTLTKKVIKKLKKGKTYTVKVTYLKDTIKTTVKVK